MNAHFQSINKMQKSSFVISKWRLNYFYQGNFFKNVIVTSKVPLSRDLQTEKSAHVDTVTREVRGSLLKPIDYGWGLKQRYKKLKVCY